MAPASSSRLLTRLMPKLEPLAAGLDEKRQAQVLDDGVNLLLGEDGAGLHVKAARRADARGAVDGLGKLLLGAHGAGKHARERVGDVEYLEEALDAAVLAVATVQRREGHVVASGHEPLRKVLLGNVIEVYLRKSGVEKSLAALCARLHGDVPLV